MADHYADGGFPGPGAGKSIGTLANWLGALVSVALIVGVAVWGYRLLVRDVSGVPVVRAVEGPSRILPDDPGGALAVHQGLSVNTVASVGSAAPPPDRLVLAPAPQGLEDEDAPSASLSVEAASEAEENETTETSPATGEVAGVDDLVARLTEGATALGAQEPETTAAQVAMAVSESLPEPMRAGGFGVSLRPVVRPASLATLDRAAQPASTALAPGQPDVAREVSADAIPEGTRLAQLGAFDSPEVARAEWAKLSQRFGEFMAGKERVIQRAESGGRTFYRLRAMGFADLSDARRFCAAFVAEKADCIPVVTR